MKRQTPILIIGLISLMLAGCAELMAVNTVVSVAKLASESANASAAQTTPAKPWTGEVCILEHGIDEAIAKEGCSRLGGVMRAVTPSLSVGCEIRNTISLHSVSYCKLSQGGYDNTLSALCQMPNGNKSKSSILSCLKNNGSALELLAENDPN